MLGPLDRKSDSEPKKFTRTGEKSFVCEHDDGSQFHGVVDNKERFSSQLSKESLKPPASRNSFSVGICLRGDCINRNIKCDECNRHSYYMIKEKENGSS